MVKREERHIPTILNNVFSLIEALIGAYGRTECAWKTLPGKFAFELSVSMTWL